MQTSERELTLHKQLDAKIDSTKSALVAELADRGIAAQSRSDGYFSVNGMALHASQFRIAKQHRDYGSFRLRLTGKLYYTLSKGYSRHGTSTKTYPEPKAGFDISKMADRLLAIVDALKAATTAREEHEARKERAEATRDRVRKLFEASPVAMAVTRSIDVDAKEPGHVFVTLDLAEDQAQIFLDAIASGELVAE